MKTSGLITESEFLLYSQQLCLSCGAYFILFFLAHALAVNLSRNRSDPKRPPSTRLHCTLWVSVLALCDQWRGQNQTQCETKLHSVHQLVTLGFCGTQHLKLTYVLSFTAALDVLSKLHLPTAPPPLNEGESLVSRILQLGPPGTKFLG